MKFNFFKFPKDAAFALTESTALVIRLQDENDRLREQVKLLQCGVLAVNGLIDDSSGVVGLHMNGDIATWDSLRTGGQFESWLIEFDEAFAATKPEVIPE